MTLLQPQGSRPPPTCSVHISVQQGKSTPAEAPLVVSGLFIVVTVPLYIEKIVRLVHFTV